MTITASIFLLLFNLFYFAKITRGGVGERERKGREREGSGNRWECDEQKNVLESRSIKTEAQDLSGLGSTGPSRRWKELSLSRRTPGKRKGRDRRGMCW